MAAAAVVPVGPDPFELGSLGVESLKRSAGHRNPIHLTDQKAAVGRREIRGRDRPQPGHDRRRRALVALRILGRQFVQQGLGPGIVRAHRDETTLLRVRRLTGWWHHYISNVSRWAAFRRDYVKTART